MKSMPFQLLALDSLKKQYALAEQLLTLLKQEYDTLSSNYVDPLNEVIGDKKKSIIELNTLNQDWLTLLATESVASTPEDIEKFLQGYDQTNETLLHKQWLSLQTIAKECQKTNTINGTIITLRYQSTQQTLSILRGQLPGDSVYNPQGNNTSNYSGGNAIAKA